MHRDQPNSFKFRVFLQDEVFDFLNLLQEKTRDKKLYIPKELLLRLGIICLRLFKGVFLIKTLENWSKLKRILNEFLPEVEHVEKLRMLDKMTELKLFNNQIAEIFNTKKNNIKTLKNTEKYSVISKKMIIFNNKTKKHKKNLMDINIPKEESTLWKELDDLFIKYEINASPSDKTFLIIQTFQDMSNKEFLGYVRQFLNYENPRKFNKLAVKDAFEKVRRDEGFNTEEKIFFKEREMEIIKNMMQKKIPKKEIAEIMEISLENVKN